MALQTVGLGKDLRRGMEGGQAKGRDMGHLLSRAAVKVLNRPGADFVRVGRAFVRRRHRLVTFAVRFVASVPVVARTRGKVLDGPGAGLQ